MFSPLRPGNRPCSRVRAKKRRRSRERQGDRHRVPLFPDQPTGERRIHGELHYTRKIRWLLKPGGTAVLMYNGRRPGDMDFYRNLGTMLHGSDAAPVGDEFWTVRQDDDPDWLTVVGPMVQSQRNLR